MKTSLKTVITLSALALMLGSCSTIMTGINEDININGQQEEPVTIQTHNRVYENVMLPQIVSVKKKHLNEKISVTSDHYVYQNFIPGRETSPWLFGNIFFGGIVGFGVDALTGGMYQAKSTFFDLQAMPKQPATHSDGAEDSTSHSFVVPKQTYDRAYDATTSKNAPVTISKPQVRRNSNYVDQPAVYHEIELGLDFGGRDDGRYHDFKNDMMRRFNLGIATDDPFVFRGARVGYHLGYTYHTGRQWAMGINLGMFATNHHLGIKSSTDEKIAETFGSCYTHTDLYYAMPHLRYRWWTNADEWLSTYSQVAMGVVEQKLELGNFTNGEKTVPNIITKRTHFAYHLTLLGIDIGSWKKSHFFAELGYGYQGYFKTGLKLVFKQRKSATN